MSYFTTTCPKCKAPPEEAMLEVISGTFQASKMYLQEDGFSTMDAKQFNTDLEHVRCNACHAVFCLSDCLVEEPLP